VAIHQTEFQLAQVNVGRLRAPLDSPDIAEFVALLAPLNALADASPGFVWRLQTEAGNATEIKAFDDELMILNMSVWRSLEDLRNYVYRSEHVQVLRRRRDWFEKLSEIHLALWWMPDGRRPTVEEALWRVELIRANGPTPEAFTFRAPFGPPVPARRRPAAVGRRVLLGGLSPRAEPVGLSPRRAARAPSLPARRAACAPCWRDAWPQA
jgi:hypothetical protein